ncbi:MAG: hypothetical protein IKB50_02775 [Clostridia bacterium]|nr:hypothetical protein [Clostridia bacterium]
MKKIISILLIAIICVTSLTPVFADDSSTVSALILKMKNIFAISDEEFVFENFSKNDYSGNVSYSLNWKSRADDTYERKPYISIEVEADGDVTYYRKGYTSYQTPSLPKFTEGEVIAKAKGYIESIAPDRALCVNDGKLYEGSQYMVEFERIENGIPVHGNGISIDLNPETLELVSYSANWSEVEFPSLESAINREDAIKAYADNLGYEVVYNISTEGNKIREIYTSYIPKAPNAFIDPFTGKATAHAELIYAVHSMGAVNDKATEESMARLSPEEIQMLEEIKQMISKEDAEKLARGIPEFDIRKDAVVENFSISKNQYGEYIAHITFRAEVKDGYYSVNLGINAKTKEIITFGKSQNYDPNDAKYDAEKAEKKAIAFIEKYYGEKFAKTKPQFSIGNNDGYSFTFDRYENGIRVKGNAISVRVNQYTGEIINVSCTWADTEFPEPDIKVAKEDIYTRILTEDNYRLQYNVITDYIYDTKTGKESRTTTVHPVYAVIDSPLFATDVLREIDYSGKPVAEAFTGYADTEGHYCHDAASALGKLDIYFQGENLMPDKVVTQEEFLTLMYIAIYGWRNDNVYKALILDGILTEDEIAEDITRMDAIRFTVNAMGYKDVSGLDGIFNCSFTDVEENMKGYAAIAGGFGLVNTGTDTLRSNDLMTRAECIMILYNYLKR